MRGTHVATAVSIQGPHVRTFPAMPSPVRVSTGHALLSGAIAQVLAPAAQAQVRQAGGGLPGHSPGRCSGGGGAAADVQREHDRQLLQVR